MAPTVFTRSFVLASALLCLTLSGNTMATSAPVQEYEGHIPGLLAYTVTPRAPGPYRAGAPILMEFTVENLGHEATEVSLGQSSWRVTGQSSNGAPLDCAPSDLGCKPLIWQQLAPGKSVSVVLDIRSFDCMKLANGRFTFAASYCSSFPPHFSDVVPQQYCIRAQPISIELTK